MNLISKNDVLEGGGKRYRLLKVEPTRDTAYVIDINDPLAAPVQCLQSTLRVKLERGELAFLQDYSGPEATLRSEPVGTSPKLRERRWAMIEPLLEQPTVLDRDGRKKLLPARADEMGCSTRTLMRPLRFYWQGGMTKDSLAPQLDKRGVAQSNTQAASRWAAPQIHG